MTTSTLQQLVYLHGRRDVGRRALVVGAEHVSFSAIATLHHAGARTVGMVTELPRHQSLAAFRAGAAVRYRTRVWTRTAVTEIRGRPRVEEVELTDLRSGRVRTVECDLVVFTADWIPDHELAVMAGCELEGGSLGPRVDGALHTPVPGVFAAGNLVHPAETADICALDGRHAAASLAAHLGAPAGEWPAHLRVVARPPIAWVFPSLVHTADHTPPRGRFVLRSERFLRAPKVEVRQGERTLWSGRLRRLAPGRSGRIPAGWTSAADPAGADITVAVK